MLLFTDDVCDKNSELSFKNVNYKKVDIDLVVTGIRKIKLQYFYGVNISFELSLNKYTHATHPQLTSINTS